MKNHPDTKNPAKSTISKLRKRLYVRCIYYYMILWPHISKCSKTLNTLTLLPHMLPCSYQTAFNLVKASFNIETIPEKKIVTILGNWNGLICKNLMNAETKLKIKVICHQKQQHKMEIQTSFQRSIRANATASSCCCFCIARNARRKQGALRYCRFHMHWDFFHRPWKW